MKCTSSNKILLFWIY